MFTTEYILQQLLNGIVLGSMYALLGLGMTVVYGILRLINFAHGALVTLGAFIGFFALMKLDIPLWLAIGILMVAGAATGLVLDAVGYRELRGGPEVALLITSLGVYIFIENSLKITLSPQTYPFRTPSILQGLQTSGTIAIRNSDIFTVAFSLVLTAAFTLFVKKTRLGIAMRATAENLETARLMGVNVDRVITIAFMLGSAIAAITGFMWAVRYGQIQYSMGFMAGVKAFIACVVGGLGSIPGAVLGGYLIGVTEILSIGLLPEGFTAYRDGIVFAVLIVVLLVRPSGILGRREDIRA